MLDLIYGVMMVVAFGMGYWSRGYQSPPKKPEEYDNSADWWKDGEEPPEWTN